MLLFDENLSARLGPALAAQYPNCTLVGDRGLAAASDSAIWQCARDTRLTIVSKDADFQRFSILYRAPPKVIWLRSGNCSTEDIIRLLRARRDQVSRFIIDEEASFLSLA